MDRHAQHKALIASLRMAMRDATPASVRAALGDAIAPEAPIRLCHPFGTVQGPDAFFDVAYAPLLAAWPDLERRDCITIAGDTPEGADWVGCAGWYMGTFAAPWLGIPPSGHVVRMRFHEFFRIENGRISEVQAIWDLPEVMMQVGAWPMAPSLGCEGAVNAPASSDGITDAPRDPDLSRATRTHIIDMLTHMSRHPSQGGPDVMEMARFWHPRMMWYGPAGIGTTRGIAGFRAHHQIPFLAAMPDRGQMDPGAPVHFLAEGNYGAVTGWPNMKQTLTGDGWLGLAPAGQVITLRSLDFWRLEGGLIRENWVLVDLLDVFAQLGIDVLARLRALRGLHGGDRQ